MIDQSRELYIAAHATEVTESKMTVFIMWGITLTPFNLAART